MAVTEEEFRSALARFPSGVTVVTARDASGALHGLTVSAFCSVSLVPPLILVCIEKIAGSHAALKESKAFTVNILNDSQSHLSDHFASQITDKFGEIIFKEGTNGLPVLEEVAATLECSIYASHDAGDHTIFVGEVEKASVSDSHPLAYVHGGYRSIPH